MKLDLKKGFTLLEMLVVIGIIAVLLGTLAVSFSAAQKKSRDAKRKQDLTSIRNAFEQYYSQCGFVYPTTGSGGSPAFGTTFSGTIKGAVSGSTVCNTSSGSNTFIDLPKDPFGAWYTYTGDASSYTICPPPVTSGGTILLETDTTCTTTTKTCCVTNQQ